MHKSGVESIKIAKGGFTIQRTNGFERADVLALIGAGVVALKPYVGRFGLGPAQALEQPLLDGSGCVNGFATDLLDAETLDEVVRALEIDTVFAVIPEEYFGGLNGSFAGFHYDQQIRFANAFTGRSTDDDLPTAILPDKANVFYSGFGTIPGATNDSEFRLMGSEQVFEAPLEFDAYRDGVLRAKAAELGTNTGLHHANTFGVSLAGAHAEVFPDQR